MRRRWLARLPAQDLDAQGVVHLLWALAALRASPRAEVAAAPPPREWMRAACGAAAARLKGMSAGQVVCLVEALTVLE